MEDFFNIHIHTKSIYLSKHFVLLEFQRANYAIKSKRSCFFSSKENSDHRPYKNNRSNSYKKPFKCVNSYAKSGGFGIAVIPAKIRTA